MGGVVSHCDNTEDDVCSLHVCTMLYVCCTSVATVRVVNGC